MEVECSGSLLPTVVDFLSLVLFNKASGEVLATLKTSKNTCETFIKMSLCTIDQSDIRRSVLRTLVTDFPRNRPLVFGCNATSVPLRGRPSFQLLVSTCT